ncbi:MAG: 30S ribosomal protein S12 methylthiotransferase RimO [Bacteroidales bacterium]|jgi:ribosomal protein S12 methylthiotransferase|nr:30S ribosomal protein S12 methylthiotransferase RimO [Bacteroidales bacterium]
MNTKKKVNIITMGCSKNLVDSEYLIKQLEGNQFDVVHNSDDTNCDIVIINTCGFINDAKQESIDIILQYEEARKKGEIEKVLVFGCLVERYKKELQSEIQSIDNLFGVYDIPQIVESLNEEYKHSLVNERTTTTPKHYAYLKISDGCDRSCSFCAIPLIKGKHKSKPIEALVEETKFLVKKGVKEIILIAQDLSYYGYDIYKEFKLAELVEKLADIEGVEWMRLHYAFPSQFPHNVIDVINNKKNICKYLDIPVQHISSNVLNNMHRGIGKEETYKLIDFFRKEIPDIALRTTLLVGHPGETEENFNELLEFIKYAKFDRLGVFTYSEEENTYSAKKFEDNIPDEIKQERANKIMELQQAISLELNTKKIGETYKVIIDRIDEEFIIGRTEYDSPEVDNEVLISKTKDIEIGNFYNVKITSADDFELFGEIV